MHIGVSSTVITPENGCWIAGDAPGRRSTGVHDDLMAKAIVFDDGKQQLAILAVDCIGLNYPDVNRIRAAASAIAANGKLTPERVVVCSTHCHSGPDVIGIWGSDRSVTGYDAAYMSHLVDTAAKCVANAATAAVPATLHYAETSCDSWVENICEPGVLDRAVTTLVCRDRAGKTIATLTNFACHPTIMDAATSLLSADYPWAFAEAMHRECGGEHLFLQGAVGGWVQPDKGEQTFDVAQQRGHDLASRVTAAIKNVVPLNGDTIAFASKKIQVPCGNEPFKQLSAAGVVPRTIGDTVDTEVVWFSIGDAQFATHPGETAPAHSFATKAMMKTGPKFVIGLGLDELGYILKKDYFEPGKYPHAEYLTSMSPGPHAEDVIMAALRQIIPV